MECLPQPTIVLCLLASSRPISLPSSAPDPAAISKACLPNDRDVICHPYPHVSLNLRTRTQSSPLHFVSFSTTTPSIIAAKAAVSNPDRTPQHNARCTQHGLLSKISAFPGSAPPRTSRQPRGIPTRSRTMPACCWRVERRDRVHSRDKEVWEGNYLDTLGSRSRDVDLPSPDRSGHNTSVFSTSS